MAKPARMIVFISVMTVFAAASSTGQSGAPSPSRAAYNVGGNLGFALMRSQSQNPEQPVNEAGRQWLLRDFEAAYKWSSMLSSCVAFDVSRFQAAYSLVSSSNPPAAQLSRLIDQLQRDYATAIARSRCSFNVGTVPQLNAIYQAGLATGVATGRSSHYYIDQRLPADAVTYIGNDVQQIRPRLEAASECLAPLDGVNSAIAGVLSRLTQIPARSVYEEITRVYIDVENLAQTPRCAPTGGDTRPGPGGPGLDVGSCMRASCGDVCQGAVVLLGQVSGSPECLACIKQKCRQ